MDRKIKAALILLVLSCWAIPQYGQYGNIWLPLGLDFNTFPPSFSDTVMQKLQENMGYSSVWIQSGEANSTVCDHNGNLLFYTDGTRVVNKRLEIMPNGYNIVDTTPGIDIPNPIRSTRGGALIVPFINEDSLFYIFSLGGSTSGADFAISKKLFYSIVDLRLGNGLGDIVAGKKNIFLSEPYAEGMLCVPGNSCNAWLVLRHIYSGDFYAFEITEGGINTEPVVSIDTRGVPSHVMSFNYSTKSNKFLMATDHNHTLYDFDPNTGKLSQPIDLVAVNNAVNFNSFQYIAFDSSGQFVFYWDAFDKVSYRADVSVYNREAIRGSREQLPFPAGGGFILGPDGNLYCTDNTNYGYIPNPADTIAALRFVSLPSMRRGIWDIFTRPNPPILKIMTNDPPLTEYKAIENNSCFARGSTRLEINQKNPWKIRWSTGDTVAAIEVTQPGLYWAQYRLSPCEEHIDTFEVKYAYPPLPELDIVPSCLEQDNGKARFLIPSYDSADYFFVWVRGLKDTVGIGPEVKDLSPGKYEVKVQQDTCFTTVEVVIPEVTEHVSWTLSDTLICVGESIGLTMDSDYFYQPLWKLNDLSFSTDPKASLKGLATGQHLLQLIAASDLCTDTLTQMIYVDKQEGISFVQDRQEICVGESVHINLPIRPVNLTTLSWQVGTHQYQTDQFESISSAFDNPGVFPIVLTAQFRACPDTSYGSEVKVYPVPEVYLGQASSVCYMGSFITLKNLSAGPVQLKTLWSTGDTTASIKVTTPGTYSVTQTDGVIGCSGTGTITIAKDCFTQMPNAFTPNGDGVNDYFFPRQYLSSSVETFKLQVYNRWGQLIYETNSTEGRGWDGKFNGIDQPFGVYVYKIALQLKNDVQEIYDGNVSLIR